MSFLITLLVLGGAFGLLHYLYNKLESIYDITGIQVFILILQILIISASVAQVLTMGFTLNVSSSTIHKLKNIRNEMPYTCPYIRNLPDMTKCRKDLKEIQGLISEFKDLDESIVEYMVPDEIQDVDNFTDDEITQCCSIKDRSY